MEPREKERRARLHAEGIVGRVRFQRMEGEVFIYRPLWKSYDVMVFLDPPQAIVQWRGMTAIIDTGPVVFYGTQEEVAIFDYYEARKRYEHLLNTNRFFKDDEVYRKYN